MKTNNNNLFILADKIIPYALTLMILMGMIFFGNGCSGSDYERIPGPTDSSASADAGTDGPLVLTPPGTTSPPDSNSGACKPVPTWWDLRSYQGCMPAGSSRMGGAYRGSNRLEHSFTGKTFLDTEGDRKGEQGSLFYLTHPSSKDCGPVKVAMVSSSGSVTIQVASQVEFYTLRSASVQAVWTKLHGGSAPTADQYYSPEFSSLLLDLFECERESFCSLTNKVPAGLLTGIVQDNGTSNSAVANGAFCEHLFLVMRSK